MSVRNLWCFMAWLVLAIGCKDGGGETFNTQAEGESHWLALCGTSGDCGEGASCVCGVCTTPCDADEACGAFGEVAVCAPATWASSQCGSLEVAFCSAECGPDAPCPAGLRCAEGICAPQSPPEPQEDAGVSCEREPAYCNWCNGETITDADGCFVRYECANGADPCQTDSCESSGCPAGELCAGDGLCWPEEQCEPAPLCNWCNGEMVTDASGCFVRYECSDGTDPCQTAPCYEGNTCPNGSTCYRDGLCRPGVECDPVPSCNWCGGADLTDDQGCTVGFECANGADPCQIEPCDDVNNPCPAGEICGDDMLCWPDCSEPADCNWCGGVEMTSDEGCFLGYECANGVNACETSPCMGDEDCAEGARCAEDGLCWPEQVECPPVPPCNWCNGEAITDADGCTVGYECANGVDPCAVDPCDEAENPCGEGEYCDWEMLCRPECYQPMDCNWCGGGDLLDEEGCLLGYECANGVNACETGPCGPDNPCDEGYACGDDMLCWPACEPPRCNWCGGEPVEDERGCTVDYECANGALACQTQICDADNPCPEGEACGEGGLCWAECPPLMFCNWCGGEQVIDERGCAIGYECANGVDPCQTNPCDADNPCDAGETCGEDGLCWRECPPLMDCNWCGGAPVYDAQGCEIGYECANGADPCATEMCVEGGCPEGERCGEDGLCWPEQVECPPAMACNWCGGEDITDADGCVIGYECANGVDPCVSDDCEFMPCGAGEVCEDRLCWADDGAGAVLTCGPDGIRCGHLQICVETVPGVPGADPLFECVDILESCEADRACACVGERACGAAGACNDDGLNRVSCLMP